MEKPSSDAGQFAVPVLFLIISAIVFWQTNTDLVAKNIATGSMQYNAAFVPEMLATLIAVLSVFVAFQTWRKVVDAAPDEPRGDLPPESHLFARSLVGLLIIAAYIMTVRFLGYHIATPLMLGSLLLLLNVRNLIWMSGLSVGISFASAYVFGRLLNVVLPAGVFEIAPF